MKNRRKKQNIQKSYACKIFGHGLKVKEGSGMPVIPRLQEILFSLTGEIMERLIMLEL